MRRHNLLRKQTAERMSSAARRWLRGEVTGIRGGNCGGLFATNFAGISAISGEDGASRSQLGDLQAEDGGPVMVWIMLCHHGR